jgi:isochorismate synthase
MTGTKNSESFFQLIGLCIQKNIPFVCFKLPNEPGFQTWIIKSGNIVMAEGIADVMNRSGFIYAPFHRKTNFPVIFYKPELIIDNTENLNEVIDRIEAIDPLYPEYYIPVPEETPKSLYIRQASDMISRFDRRFRKAVLSRVKHILVENRFNPGRFFFRLQNEYPEAFCHLIHIPNTGTWSGATPEMLLRTDHLYVKTVSLAGTRKSAITDGKTEWGKKEIEEQGIVTAYIEDLLRKFAVSEYMTRPTQTIKAGVVSHLSTAISFLSSDLKNRVGDFLEELHPTPAVCGFPKEDALRLILKTEGHNREYYAGICGLINMENKTDLFVNLRCMKILNDKVVLYIGGGLTAGSDPENEWEEGCLKAQTLSNLLDK